MESHNRGEIGHGNWVVPHNISTSPDDAICSVQNQRAANNTKWTKKRQIGGTLSTSIKKYSSDVGPFVSKLAQENLVSSYNGW